MAWVAVDENEEEAIYDLKPTRMANEWISYMDEGNMYIELPKGSIEKQ